MFQVCVSGAAHGVTVKKDAEAAYQIGKLLAKRGHTVMTGATTGLPLHASMGAKEVGGKSIGISPAVSRREHVLKYRLPTKGFDTIIFTGMNYVGRDVFLVQSSDAVISVGGRMGTLHEFATAVEGRKPIAVLEGSGGTSELFDDLLRAAGRRKTDIIFESDPKKLVERLEVLLYSVHKDDLDIYKD